MRNEQAVVISKAMSAIGVGILEKALAEEGRKGCSPFLCSEPVSLEPPYERFDSSRVLRGATKTAGESRSAESYDWVTLNVFAADDDVLSIGWCETVLRALSVLSGPLAFELYGGDGVVWVRFAVPSRELPGLRAALLGHFFALVLREVEDPFPSSRGVVVNELCPVAPYHRSLTLLGKEGASPLGLAATVIAGLGRGECGLFQVLLAPASCSGSGV